MLVHVWARSHRGEPKQEQVPRKSWAFPRVGGAARTSTAAEAQVASCSRPPPAFRTVFERCAVICGTL
eukprot:4374964-Pyramimonas_sp.AAC.1